MKTRKRRETPSDRRRKALRALSLALFTAERIQGDARHRQRARLDGEANAATILDTDLRLRYDGFTDDKREIFSTGLVPNGDPYKGRTWKSR